MSYSEKLSHICENCALGGQCCRGAMPPLTRRRVEVLLDGGVDRDFIEYGSYKRLKLKPDAFCVLYDKGCTIHSIKPETCVAGPFTFDVKRDVLEIYLKNESICPMVGYLKEDRSAYQELYEKAVASILDLLKDLPPEELEAVLKIDEPETVKVGEIPLKRGDR